MGNYQVKTKHGYDFFEVSSAFQKAIRRGDEHQALTWGVELWMSGYKNYVWKRMAIIVSEDIGLAQPEAPAVFWSLYQKYQYWVAQPRETGKLEYYHAISYLTRCRKSRYIDLLIAKYEYQYEMDDGSIEIPDYAFDMHTRKGKRMGRGMDHFYDEGGVIKNANKVPGEEELEKQCRFYDAEMEKINRKKRAEWKKEQEEKKKGPDLFNSH